MVKIIISVFLFICLCACSVIYNKKSFVFSDTPNERKLRTNGYYYHVYNLDKEYMRQKGVYINMQLFLDNGYTYVVKNGFGDYCGDLIEKECAVKASEYMLDKNINEFLEETDKQSNRNYYIWNWGKYHIQNDTIVVKWFYNSFGDYFLVEEKGIVTDSTTIDFFYFKDYQTNNDTIYKIPKTYNFKVYPIDKIYNKIPRKLVEWK